MKELKPDTYDYWIAELEAEHKAHKDWRKQGQAVIERYKDEEKDKGARFNILWSNTQTLHAALYSNTPKPDISRRFKDKNPVTKAVAEVLERALSYSLDRYPIDENADIAVDDFLLPGLGVMRVRYQPYFEKEPTSIQLTIKETPEEIKYLNGEEEVDPEKVDFDGDVPVTTEEQDVLVYQETYCEAVPWNRFRWQPADKWENVNWVCFDHYLTREELTEQVPEEHIEFIPLNYNEHGESEDQSEDGKTRALLHEIYDKKRRKVLLIAPGHKKVINSVEDPLNLENFFPVPRPLMSNTLSGDLVPVPDYVIYQDLAMELDTITQRIAKLTDQMRYRGVYDSSFEALQNVAHADDGEFVPIDDFTERFEGKGTFDSVIKTMDLDQLRATLSELYKARELTKQTIYEITGISDIVRGATKASETATAQRIKGQFADLRLERKRREVERFMRDLFRLKCEIIAEHFEAETLQLMTGLPVLPEMVEIMRSDVLRGYKIDVETDSTVAQDMMEEQNNRNELLRYIIEYINGIAQPLMAGMITPEFAKEGLLFGIRAYKGGRMLEDAIEAMPMQPMPVQPGIQQSLPPNVTPMGVKNGPV